MSQTATGIKFRDILILIFDFFFNSLYHFVGFVGSLTGESVKQVKQVKHYHVRCVIQHAHLKAVGFCSYDLTLFHFLLENLCQFHFLRPKKVVRLLIYLLKQTHLQNLIYLMMILPDLLHIQAFCGHLMFF